MSYLRGELRRGGWWYSYLYALLIKTPLGVLLLAGVAIAVRIAWGPRRVNFHDVTLLLPFGVVLFLVSSQTGINKHLRYVLPVLSFAFIRMSQVARAGHWLLRRLILGCVTWAVASVLWIYPHELSYFNELAGGPRHGHRHLINSNIAWGQDLFFLKELLAARGIRHVQLVFGSRYDPRHAGIHCELPPTRDMLTFDAAGKLVSPLKPGVYALSINHLRGYPFVTPDGRGGRVLTQEHAYSYFLQLEPFATAEYSLYVFSFAGSNPTRGTPESDATRAGARSEDSHDSHSP